MSTALVELRRYRLHPGRRDALAALFARELVTTQEAVGLQVLAWFRDAGEPDHFVWLRGFPTEDPQERADALAAFYGGPAWAAHADAANATMRDSDDVLLLRPLQPGPDALRGAFGPEPLPLTTCLLTRAPTRAEERALVAALPGAVVLVTAGVENAFPRLPVREGEPAAVWLGVGAVPAALAPLLLAPASVTTLERF